MIPIDASVDRQALLEMGSAVFIVSLKKGLYRSPALEPLPFERNYSII